MRKLASIRRVAAINPIPNADKIEKITVDGWEVVAQKGNYKVGDLCVYIEIDSIVPAIEYFEFMEPRKYRVKTIKLRKQVSQGLLVPKSDIDIIRRQIAGVSPDTKMCPLPAEERDNVTESLGIKKYDPELKKENLLLAEARRKKNPIHKYLIRYSWYRKLWKKKKSWPDGVVKTDEERIQNIPSILTRESKRTFYETEKLDGQSATYFYLKQPWFLNIKKKVFGVCSRNIWLKTPHPCNYWNIEKKFDIRRKLKKYGKELVIQGEIIGPGIQKNKYNLKELDFYVFNVYNKKTDEWYGRHGIEAVCDTLGLKMVPVIGQGTLRELAGTTVPEVVEHVKGSSILCTSTKREGSVFRELHAVTGKRGISFKCINVDFLCK